MKKINALLILTAACIIVSCGDNKRSKNYNAKTQVDAQALGFIKQATESGITEIKASAVAENLSKNPKVIRFAKMMVEDHTETQKELAQLAENKLVDKTDTISIAHQKTIDSIARLSGVGFDKAYINMMIKDHQQGIGNYEDASRNRIEAVQAFAKKILPALKMHLDSAKAIAATLK